MKKTKHGVHDLRLCQRCQVGRCCRDGVEVDLFEVARILKWGADLPRPWFHFLRRDRRFPSGYVFGTMLRHRRCIFQNDQRRCHIYPVRPQFCREFPLEDGKKAPYYHELCQHGRKRR